MTIHIQATRAFLRGPTTCLLYPSSTPPIPRASPGKGGGRCYRIRKRGDRFKAPTVKTAIVLIGGLVIPPRVGSQRVPNGGYGGPCGGFEAFSWLVLGLFGPHIPPPQGVNPSSGGGLLHHFGSCRSMPRLYLLPSIVFATRPWWDVLGLVRFRGDYHVVVAKVGPRSPHAWCTVG